METRIILITGKAQSGKTTTAQFLNTVFLSNGYTSKIYNFADPLKVICRDVLNIPEELLWGDGDAKSQDTHIKWGDLPIPNDVWCRLINYSYMEHRSIYTNTRMTVREILQVLGTEIFRAIYFDCWASATLHNIKKDNLNFAIVGDTRFPNEINFFLDFNPVVVKLCRNVLDNQHSSEIALDNYPWERVQRLIDIDNTTLSLEAKNLQVAKRVLDELNFKEKYIIWK